jgi:phospholipase C
MYHFPFNISTVVDLLEDKHVSWATYQENMPADEFYGFKCVSAYLSQPFFLLPPLSSSLTHAYSYLAPNYISPTSKPYPYYVRKHNPLVIYDAISQDPQRVKRIRTFNDFANDVVNGTLPQWVFVTPNMVHLGSLSLSSFLPPSLLPFLLLFIFPLRFVIRHLS